MFKLSKLAGIVTAVVLALMWAAPAQAQATRTWISGVGDDANPCSRTAPCKTFAGAISKTAAGGEIDCLDPGGFGAVTITKSITIDCGGGNSGQVGSILVSGTNGINVSAQSTDLVKIRNLTINGIQKTGGAGLSGIKFNTAASLIVEHVGIFGFGGSTGNNGGIDFRPTVAAKLFTVDVDIQYGLADGILIRPTSTGSATAVLNRTSILANVGTGLRIDNTDVASGNGVKLSMFNTDIAGSATGVLVLAAAGQAPAVVNVTNSIIAQNSAIGVLASGTNATINIGGSSVSGNTTGMVASGGQVKSFGDNYFSGNGSNGTPTAPNLSPL